MKQDELARCKEELEAVKEQNEHLREAASVFGALAERLRDRLEVERRHGIADRRRLSRDTPDRRQHAADAPERKHQE